MNINKLIILIFLFIGSITFTAQTFIKGKADNYVGHEIVAYQYSDLFSLTQIKIGSSKIEEDGSFNLVLNLEKNQLIKFSVNRVHTILFVDVNRNNDIIIHAPSDKVVRTYANTIVSGEISPGVIDKLIKSFDVDYNNFLEKSAFSLKLKMASSSSYQKSHQEELKGFKVESNSKKDSIPITKKNEYSEQLMDFRTEIEEKFHSSKTENPFFADYVNYYIANLELINTKREVLYNTYIKADLDYSNPGVISFITNFYSVLWEYKTNTTKKSLKSILKSERSYFSLDTFGMKLPYLEMKELRDITLINSLYKLYKTNSSEKELALLLLVQKAKENILFPNLIAKNYVNKIVQYKRGVSLKDFELLNKREDIITLENYEGKYVYFSFFTSWCVSCEREQYLIQNLKKEYGNKIEFVSINMDDDYQDFKKFLSKHRKFDWDFLYGPSDPEVMAIFNIKTIPSYIMIDPNGNWMFDYTLSPSEGAQIEMANILKKGYVAPQKNRVWDD